MNHFFVHDIYAYKKSDKYQLSAANIDIYIRCKKSDWKKKCTVYEQLELGM
jgi:hypothetical protein